MSISLLTLADVSSLPSLPDTGTYLMATVVLPDGDVGTISTMNACEIHVVHLDRDNGRGHWIYPRIDSGLRMPTECIEEQYNDRVNAFPGAWKIIVSSGMVDAQPRTIKL